MAGRPRLPTLRPDFHYRSARVPSSPDVAPLLCHLGATLGMKAAAAFRSALPSQDLRHSCARYRVGSRGLRPRHVRPPVFPGPFRRPLKADARQASRFVPTPTGGLLSLTFPYSQSLAGIVATCQLSLPAFSGYQPPSRCKDFPSTVSPSWCPPCNGKASGWNTLSTGKLYFEA